MRPCSLGIDVALSRSSATEIERGAKERARAESTTESETLKPSLFPLIHVNDQNTILRSEGYRVILLNSNPVSGGEEKAEKREREKVEVNFRISF